MSKSSRGFLVLLGTVVVLAVVAYLVVGAGRVRVLRGGLFFSRTTAHWYGWVGLALFGVSAAYSLLKRIFPRSVRIWLLVHCILAISSLIVIGIHILGRLAVVRPSHFLSFFLFGLMFVIVVGGITGRYRVRIPVLGEYWRYLHLNLTVIFYVTLTLHILEKLWLV